MIATFIIEISAAMYTVFKYHRDLNAKLIISLLVFLATFQLAEYMVCVGALGLSSLEWAKLGYVAITILPPLALHLGMSIAKKDNPRLLAAAYGSAAMFMTFFLFVGHGMQSQQCLGNYVIFKIAPYASLPYGIYYQGWLVIGIVLAWIEHGKIKDQNRQKALMWLVIGYLSFMVPSFVVSLIDRHTLAGLPSIMCGFAVLMALNLLFKVAPLILKENNHQQSPKQAY
jgi:hypothetical protein